MLFLGLKYDLLNLLAIITSCCVAICWKESAPDMKVQPRKLCCIETASSGQLYDLLN